jgi:hypothetical protein
MLNLIERQRASHVVERGWQLMGGNDDTRD